MADQQRLQHIRRFLHSQGWDTAEYLPLAGDASFRRYVRLRRKKEARILMDAPPEHEKVDIFITVAEYLVRKGLSAPRIFAQDAGAGLLLLEDLGEESFTSLLRVGQAAETEEELYRAAVEALLEVQDRSRKDPASVPLYDHARLMQEVSLFSDWYMPAVVGKEKTSQLRGEFISLWDELLKMLPAGGPVFVHRDYHADNLFWLRERHDIQRVGMLDFQDAVSGHAAYDLVSLLEDARRDVPEALAERMIHFFMENSRETPDAFRQAYALLGAQRNTKIIGIFTRLSVRDGKHHYLKHLPRVWKYLERDMTHPALTPLRRWMDINIPLSKRILSEMPASGASAHG